MRGMNQFIFKSRWIAIAFAALTLFSVYAFVGGEDDGGLFGGIKGDLTDQVDETGSQLAAIGTAEPVPTEAPPEMMVEEEFFDDTELVDSASGEDPSPDGGDESMVEDDVGPENGDIEDGTPAEGDYDNPDGNFEE